MNRWHRSCTCVLAAGVFMVFVPTARGQENVEHLQRDVQALCAEIFEGRGAGSAGLTLAASFIEERFQELGLRGLGEAGYRQQWQTSDGKAMVNLIAVLKGEASDSGKSTAGEVASRHVVLGAHYDHLGRGEPGSANAGALHPGADDNASGVAALLECARQMRSAGPPAHDVVFVAFSGEETGLLGSAYYVEHPARALSECTAMLNLDTVGRLAGNKLTIFGAETAQQLPDVLRGVNIGFGFELQMPEKDPGGSDQMSFVRRGVPAIQLFTGAHADYHRPADTPDKIDYEGLARIADYTHELVRYVADRDEPFGFVPPGAASAAAQPAAGRSGARRVTFGSIPDFNHKGVGVLLSGVVPGSPAEKAGMRAGDVIVEFAGVAIEDLQGYSDVLKGIAPGDEADVVFVRNGERHTVRVTVAERK